jgi:hypothetical protein
MYSLALGLTFASYASAQVFSMVDLNAASSASASSPMSAPPASTMPSSSSTNAPPAYSMSASDSSAPAYSPPPSYGSAPPSYNQYTAPPAQYTPPPPMPYESFMNGGYKSMGCGYGYQKGSDGSCMTTESWVRIFDCQDVECSATDAI